MSLRSAEPSDPSSGLISSFNADSYEYVEGTKTLFGGGQAKETIPSTGATWKERDASGNERILFCPLTAILAISYGRASGKKSK